MRQSTQGTTCPAGTATIPSASQALATNTAYSPTHVACLGARATGGVVVVSARGPMPRTAGGCDPTLSAYVDANDFVTVRLSNNNANALVALGTDLLVAFIQLPLAP